MFLSKYFIISLSKNILYNFFFYLYLPSELIGSTIIEDKEFVDFLQNKYDIPKKIRLVINIGAN